MDTKPPRPTASSIVPRLLDAVEALCVASAPSGVTMRMIASEAGLSLGVAYRYFESRDALFGATLDRMADRIVAAAADDDPTIAIPALWKEVGDNPAFPRLVTSFVMSGRYAPDVMSEDPLIRHVVGASTAFGADDPETIAAITGILVLAGVVFAPTLNRAVERRPDDPRAYDALVEMFTVWLEARRAKAVRA